MMNELLINQQFSETGTGVDRRDGKEGTYEDGYSVAFEVVQPIDVDRDPGGVDGLEGNGDRG